MPKISKVNCKSIHVTGTCYQGDFKASYEEIVNKLGLPSDSFCGYKSDAEWSIEFESGDVATIYNWKNGINYCGTNGLPVELIKEWHIGGSNSKVTRWVKDLILNSWPLFDEIRQEAQS